VIRDIVITLPQHVHWDDYEQELAAALDGEIKYKVNGFPDVVPGQSRCYVTHKGFVRGWMTVTGLVHDDFVCSTTGRHWQGKFVKRAGAFTRTAPYPLRGTQGFRYVDRGAFEDVR
jgi:hypothetical protein